MLKGASPLTQPTINSHILGGAFVGQEELQAGEVIVANTPGNRRQFGVIYGGHLVLTNRRLVFLPDRSGFQRPNVSLSLDSISNISAQRMRFGIVFSGRFPGFLVNTPGIAVETTSGHYNFQIGEIRTGDRARWMEMLTNAITRPTNGGP